LQNSARILSRVLCFVAAPALLLVTLASAQTRPVAPEPAARPAPPALAANAPIPSEKELASTQTELIRLLRLSPTLTTVVARDPSLLSNQEYVSRNNPQLAEFLAAHPEVVRNPAFYLFTHMSQGEGGTDEALERAVWPDVYRASNSNTPFAEFMHDLSPLLAFACFLVAVVWLTRQFIEVRRWGRIFKLQSEVHGRLIDKFSSNQELAAYMGTEAGRRFLEAAPIPIDVERSQRVPNAVARVLTPIQIGIVLSLLGAGFFLLRHAGPDMETPMTVLGTVALMPGIGFIISAAVTWVLASRLGLMPDNSASSNQPEAPGRINPPFSSREQ
jgi:hypothetical protein